MIIVVDKYDVVVVLSPLISRIVLLFSPSHLSVSTYRSLLADCHLPPRYRGSKKILSK